MCFKMFVFLVFFSQRRKISVACNHHWLIRDSQTPASINCQLIVHHMSDGVWWTIFTFCLATEATLTKVKVQAWEGVCGRKEVMKTLSDVAKLTFWKTRNKKLIQSSGAADHVLMSALLASGLSKESGYFTQGKHNWVYRVCSFFLRKKYLIAYLLKLKFSLCRPHTV